MDTIAQLPEHPFERFKAIYAHLAGVPQWWKPETVWLRFAAQAAITAPGEPAGIADAIRRMAASFHDHASWFDALRSPLRFMVAAMLVQAGRDGAAFAAELERTRALLHEHGIRRGGMFEIVTILLLWLQQGQPIQPGLIARLAALYGQLKRAHWWLTGPHDLPTCACLLALPGEPAAIAAEVEAIYQQLHRWGIPSGIALEQVAHILPLAGVRSDAAIARYTALASGFTQHKLVPLQADYEAIAVLALLDVPPDDVVRTAVDTYHRVDALRPRFHHEVCIDLAADIAFFDLIRRDRRLQLPAGSAAQQVAALMRAGQSASAIVAFFGAISLDPSSC